MSFQQLWLSEWSHLLQFIKRPNDPLTGPIYSQMEKVRRLSFILVLGLVSGMFLIFLSQALTTYLQIDRGKHEIDKLLDNKALLVFSLVIIAPLIEEVIFRIWIKFKAAYFFLWICIDGYKKITGKSQFASMKVIRSVWNYIYPAIFYLSAIAFALVHAFNFESIAQMWWFAPILTLPQFVLGCTFGYARVNYGLIYGMGLHASHNAVLASIIIFGVPA